MAKVTPDGEEKKPDLGKPKGHNPNFKGPTKKRSCTDIICCLLFLVFLSIFALISGYAFTTGDPLLLLNPVDSDGVMCGYGVNEGKKYLFYFDLVECSRNGIAVFLTGCPSPQICVTSCPNFYYSVLTDVTSNSDLKYCKTSADMTKNAYELVSSDACPAYIMKSSSVINRCVPSALVNFLNGLGSLDSNIASDVPTTLTSKDGSGLSASVLSTAMDVFGAFIKAKEYAEKIMADVIRTWWVTVMFMIVSMLVALIWIVLLRYLAGIMVWATIFAFLGAFGYAAVFCFMYYLDASNDHTDMTISLSVGQISYSKSKMYLGLGITAAVLFLIVLLVVLFMCTRLKIAIGLIKEASRAVGTMSVTLVFPIFPMFLLLLLVGYFIVFGAFLASTGRTTTSIQNTTSTWIDGQWDAAAIQSQVSSMSGSVCSGNVSSSDACAYLKNAEENFVFYAGIFALFMFLWLVNFVIAIGQLTLAGAFASYYWAFEKPKGIPMFPMAGALWKCFRYHLGSLAFGSFIIALVQFIRIVLEYLDYKFKGSENLMARFALKCLKCCFWCLEKCVRFLTKNAYIMIAIHGRNFCLSAKDAFFTILRNIVRVAVVDKVTDFILFVSKLVVMGISGALAFLFYNHLADDILSDYQTTSNSYIAPILIVVLVSYAIASCFFSVFSMAIATLFICFLEDLEMNDGSAEKPYFMSKELMGVLGVKNKITEDKQKKKTTPGDNF